MKGVYDSMLNKKTVDDLKDLKGKKVLVRCDFNVPLKDGVIQNYNRIDGAIPTIKKLLDQGAKVILCSHLGKPKGEPVPAMSLAPVAPALSERLGVEVKFVDDPKVTGEETKKVAAELKDGEVLLLQNTRYRGEETKYGKDEKADAYAKELADLCEGGVFVNDAFGTAHRAHCSNVGVTKYTKENVVGYLMEKEIKFLGQAVENPVRPFVAILGGAKVSDKLPVIENLLDKVDNVLIGGGMAFTFVKGKEVYKLKEIERYCKTKIVAMPIPSSDDVAQIKAEKVMEEIAHIIDEENLKDMINIIEEQVNQSDYTAMDIAAAFLKQALGQVNLDNDKSSEPDFGDTGAEEGMVRLFINIGKKDRVKPGDVLGAVAGESGMPGKLVGAIDMYDKYTFVEVPREYGREVLEAMKNVKIKGHSINMEPANQK